jgi:hypothetical protein
MRTTYERLEDVEKNADKLKGKFGPIEGRWNNLKVKFLKDGATQGVINELKSMITVAYSLSGKQISYKEMELLQNAMLPRLEQPYENFQATLNFAKNWMAKTHNNRLGYIKESGYQTSIKPLEEANIPTPTGVIIIDPSQFKLKGK